MDEVVRIHGDCFRNRDEQASELPQLVIESSSLSGDYDYQDISSIFSFNKNCFIFLMMFWLSCLKDRKSSNLILLGEFSPCNRYLLKRTMWVANQATLQKSHQLFHSKQVLTSISCKIKDTHQKVTWRFDNVKAKQYKIRQNKGFKNSKICC